MIPCVVFGETYWPKDQPLVPHRRRNLCSSKIIYAETNRHLAQQQALTEILCALTYIISGKIYWPKDQPPCAPHHFLLGARQSRRAIARYLSGRGRLIVPTSAAVPRPERIHCAYPSRSSQTSAAHPCAGKARPPIAYAIRRSQQHRTDPAPARRK